MVSEMAQVEGTSVSPWCLDLLGLRVVPHGQRADKVLGLQLGEFLLVSAGCSSHPKPGDPGMRVRRPGVPPPVPCGRLSKQPGRKVSISGVRFGSMSWNPLWLKLYVAPYLVLSLVCLSTCDVVSGVLWGFRKALGQYQGGIKGRTGSSSGEFLPDSHARMRPSSVLTGHSQGQQGWL